VLSQSQIRSYWSPRCTGPHATVSLYGAGKVTVDAAIVSAVKALDQVLTAYKYSTRAADTGAYVCRMNTGGTAWSNHAYGIAMDINWSTNPYGRYLRTDMRRYGDGKMPERICAIRTNNGKQVWNWGGFWSGNKDAMHYEIVCTPADIRTGINQSTIYGGSVAQAPNPVPTPQEESLVYRIHWFKGEPTEPGDQADVTAAYRTISAKAEGTNTWWIVSAWYIPNMDDVKVWKSRGLKEITVAEGLRPSIEFYNGPFDNTKTP